MSDDRIDRRQVLAGLGALAAAPPARRAVARARRQVDEARFAWGVASFDPTADGVLLWTRTDPAAGDAELRWAVAADPDLTEVVAEGTVAATAATDHCATVEVSGLPAGGVWWYRFEDADGARSPTGRTRTLPAGAVDRLRIATVSCSRFRDGRFAVYRCLADREVDLVVHLGDYVYEDGEAGVRAHDPPERLTTLTHYRRRYAQHRADPDLQALHAAHPMVAVWDDHEVADNAWRDGAAGHDDARDGPWADRLAAAMRAHEEWVPGRTRRRGDGGVDAWRAVAIGELAELLVLDTRRQRDRQATTPADLAAPGRQLLGDEQRAWLTERLRRPDRPPWVLLANQVMLHPLRVPMPSAALAEQVTRAGFLVVEGEALNPDQWDGYPREREALVAAAGDAGGVVVLTGDVHSSWAWEGPGTTADGEPAMVELVTPSVSSRPFSQRLPLPAGTVEALLRGLDPSLSHVELSRHGYVIVDLGPEELQAEWWYVEPDDPSTQAFGTARRTPRAAPMHLVEVAEPRPDPVPTTTTTAATTTTAGPAPGTPAEDGGGTGDGAGPWPVLGGVGALVAAGAGAAVALRRRRGP